MFRNLLRWNRDERIVSYGRVFCSTRECDVDVEGCFGCPNLIVFDTKAAVPHIRCQPNWRPLEMVPPQT